MPAWAGKTESIRRRFTRTWRQRPREFSPPPGTISQSWPGRGGGRQWPIPGETIEPPRHIFKWARVLAPILLALVFWLDRFSPAGVAVPALYVAPALLFIRSGRFWEPLLVALGATVLTVGDYFLFTQGGNVEIGRINVPLELLMVWLSAGLVAYHRVTSNRWSEHIERKQTMLGQTIVRLEELRQALDQAAIVATTDQRGIITYANDKFCDISKYHEMNCWARIIASSIPGTTRRNSCGTCGGRSPTVGSGVARSATEPKTGASTGLIRRSCHAWTIEENRGSTWPSVATSRKERRRKPSSRIRRRCAQLGELAAIVAHEVRNPLAGLRASLEILEPRFVATSREREVIQTMIGRIDTLNAKVNDILRFARPRQPLLQSLDLDPVIRDSIASATAAVGRGVSADRDTATSQIVRADAEMLRAALFNLLLNACQAGASRVQIRTFAESGGLPHRHPRRWVGIPDDVVAHMFEAFYTTKKTGTGLGLPIVKRLVELQEGTVSVTPREGGGTLAEVTLPQVRQPAEAFSELAGMTVSRSDSAPR